LPGQWDADEQSPLYSVPHREVALMASDIDLPYRPEQEFRFAVVLYGGVSLAIYINGVAQELLRMVRATADLPPDACVPA
jgi:hypothetical protein